MHVDAYEELHREAERQGLRVHLEAEGVGARARLKRLAVLEVDPADTSGERLREVVALRVGGRSLERTAGACLAFLQARRAAERP